MPDRPSAFNHLPRAIYVDAALPEHAGNPLVEALPPYRLVKDLGTRFGQFPRFSKAERDFPDSLRVLEISRLRTWLEPLPHDEQVIDLIGAIVRSGYVGRDPSDPEGHRQRVAFYRQAMKDGFMLPLNGTHASTAPSMALFGTSGVGKTSVVEFSLRSLLPQVIFHDQGGYAQIVWLKLDCPPDGSLKQLLLAFIGQIDRLLMTRYRTQVKGSVTDELVLFVAKLCVMHNVGLVVIDEIQNLLLSKHASRQTMLNFFVSMSNEARVPVLTMGTVLALQLLTGTLRVARRTGDLGTIIWDRIPEGPDWDLFVGGMQKYQWVKQPAKLEGALKDALFRETMGIPALVVRLFQLAQIDAITDGSETLDAELVTRLAHERFSLLRPMLDALRQGKSVAKWEDLFRVTVNNLDDALDSKADPLEKNRKHSTTRERATAILREMFGRDQAMRAVDELVSAEPDLDENAIVSRVSMALTAQDPAMDALPPTLDEELASVHSDGPDLQEAIFAERKRRGGAKRRA